MVLSAFAGVSLSRIAGLKERISHADTSVMAVSFAQRLGRPRMDSVLNVLIVVLIAIDAMVGMAVVNQNAKVSDAQPLLTAPPATTAPVATTVPAQSDGGDGVASIATFEQLQSSMVAARSLQVQNERPIEAADLTAALPGLTFVNGFTAAGPGVIGVSSNTDGFLLLTQDAAGSWVCAGTDAAGTSALGFSSERDTVASLTGCQANAR